MPACWLRDGSSPHAEVLFAACAVACLGPPLQLRSRTLTLRPSSRSGGTSSSRWRPEGAREVGDGWCVAAMANPLPLFPKSEESTTTKGSELQLMLSAVHSQEIKYLPKSQCLGSSWPLLLVLSHACLLRSGISFSRSQLL